MKKIHNRVLQNNKQPHFLHKPDCQGFINVAISILLSLSSNLLYPLWNKIHSIQINVLLQIKPGLVSDHTVIKHFYDDLFLS